MTVRGSILFISCVALVVLLPSASALCGNVTVQYASQTYKYDLSWLNNMGPWAVTDQNNGYRYTFGVCRPLMAPCPDTTGSSSLSACGAGNTSAMCQQWKYPDYKDSVCNANIQGQRSYSMTLVDAGFSGMIPELHINIGGGDYCSQCTPQFRETVFNIRCRPIRTKIEGLYVKEARLPIPTYQISFYHCSGCYVGHPFAC
jgi:hypothetical protein